ENLKIECTRMILNLIHELLHTKQLLTNSPSSKEFLTSIANYYSEEFIEKATPDVNKVFRAVTSLKECPIIIESKGNQSKLKPGSGNQQELTEESNAMLAEARINRLAPILRTTIEYPENPILNTENFAVGIQKRSTTIECDEEKFREKMGEKSLTHWPQGSDSFVETKEYDILLKLNNQIDPIIEEAFNEFAAQIFNAQE
ncbi:hypothetical protein KKG71_05000, partial [Patescibacteria group bacterium]|nr:hypothetical protein [Patescibacteria group bacterium]